MSAVCQERVCCPQDVDPASICNGSLRKCPPNAALTPTPQHNCDLSINATRSTGWVDCQARTQRCVNPSKVRLQMSSCKRAPQRAANRSPS